MFYIMSVFPSPLALELRCADSKSRRTSAQGAAGDETEEAEELGAGPQAEASAPE